MPVADRFPALLFDFDGTLIDSAPDIALALNQLLTESDRPELTLDQVKGLIGDGAPRLVEQAMAVTGQPVAGDDLARLTTRYLDIYGALPADPSCGYPGVAETLAALKQSGHRLALCTNKPAGISLELLPALGLGNLFDVVAGGDTAPRRKPHPDPLLWALDKLGCRPDQAVMVGDNGNDVAAARAAGVSVIAVAYGYPRMPLADLGADCIIERFADLPAALAGL
jgi:phosphoglycolate phosphatase